MNTGMPAAYLGVHVQAKGIGRTNAQLMRTHGVLGSVGGAATRMGKQFLAGLKYLSIGALAGVAAAGKLAISFDKEMRNVNSIAQLGEKAFGKLRARVLALAGPTAQAPKTLAAGLYDLVSSGFDADESIQILAKSARAATAGLTTTEVSTAAVAAVLNAYHLAAGKAGDTSDVLFEIVNRGKLSFEELAQSIGDVLPFGSSLGVNLREVGASIATMTLQGISAPETMTRIKAVMVTLLKPGEALSKVIKKQGYESGEAMIKALGFQGTLDALAKSTGGSKEKMGELFPNIRALGGALALTGQNSKGAQEDLKGMQDASGATAKALSQQSRSISYQWQQLRSTAEALAIKFGSSLLPELNKVMKIITNPNLTTEEKVSKVFDFILGRAEDALKAGIDLAREYGPKIVGMLVSSMARAWWDMNGLGKVLSLGVLVRVLGGKGALTATGKRIGRMLGFGVAEGMTTSMAAAAPAAAQAAAGAVRPVVAPAWSPAAPALGAAGSRQAAATATSRALLEESFGGFTLAAASASQAAGQKSATGFLRGWSSKIKGGAANIRPAIRGMGANLAQGLSTWGLGGLLVGGMTKEIVRGDTGQKIGSALEGAGVGAAIGTAIAPGIGTAIGAAVGGLGGFITSELGRQDFGDTVVGAMAAEIEANLGPKFKKAFSSKSVGDLAGLSRGLRRAIKFAVAEGAGPEAVAPLRSQLAQVMKVRDLIQEPREAVLKEIGVLRSGLATRLSDINDIFQSNIQQINQGWTQGTGRWRAITVGNMKSAVAAIKTGMREGVIETDVGQKQIKHLIRSIRLVEGRDPFGIAQGFASSWQQAGRISNSKIDAMIREMQRMPKGSREAAQNAMVQMAKTLEAKGVLVKGSAARLQSALVTTFGKTNKQIVEGAGAAGRGIAGVFSSLVGAVSGYLATLGGNVNSILKAFGVSKAVNFTVKAAKVGASAAGAVGKAVSGVVDSVTGKQTGGFIVPGTGSGDRPGFAGEVGAFVLNREATRAYGFNQGGMVPLALEPGERYFTPREVSAMGGARTLETMNRSVPRFQNGGEIGKPQMLGPAGPLRDLGQSATTKAYDAAREYIKDQRPKGGAGYDGPAVGPAGTSTYKGILMATWVRQALEYAAAHGASGQPTSGYRPPDQVISGPVVAPQGKSEHQGTQYPHGAVDFGGPYDPAAKAVKDAVVAATRSFQYPLLAPIGFRDDGHASGTGHQLGGLIQALADGGWVKTGYTIYTGSGPGAGGDLQKGKGYAELGTATSGGTGTGSGFIAKALGRSGELPFEYPLDVKVGSKIATLYKRDRGYGQGDPFYSIDIHSLAWPELGLSMANGKGNAWIRPGEGAKGGDLSAGQKKANEGKARKANYERRLQVLQREAREAQSIPAQQSKLWKLVKFWGRVGIFDKDERGHILDAVQSAAAQTKPQGSVDVLKRLAGFAKSHGEITGQDPSNFRSLEKAIERAQERGQKQRQKTAERQHKRVEGIHRRVEGKIANRAAFPDWVERLAGLRRAADVGEETAGQLVALEPENITDAYVGLERGAYGQELTQLLGWRNSTINAQQYATAEIGRFEQQIADIEALNVGIEPATALPGAKKGKGKKHKLLGGVVEGLVKGGKSGAKQGHKKPDAGVGGQIPSNTYAQYKKVAYKIPLLEQAIADAKVMRDETWTGELEEIQGLTGPKGLVDSLPSEPVAGSFGGRIFEIQNSIRELALKVSNVTSDTSELKELEAQLNTDWHKRFLVSEAQRNTIADFNAAYPAARFAGTFAGGGHIGAGQWGIAGETGEPEIVHGPARVFSPSESEAMMGRDGAPLVIEEMHVHDDGRVSAKFEGREFELAVKKVIRDGRVTGRPTSGGAR